MTWLLLFSSFAADPQALWRGIEDGSGWVEVHRKTFEDVGAEVVVRLKRVGEQPCLEASTTTTVSPDLLLHLASDIPSQPPWSTWKIPVAERLDSEGSSFDYVQVLDNPSPVSDRVWFLRGTPARVGESRVFRWDRVDAATRYPEKLKQLQSTYPDLVETRVNLGDWTFTPEDGRTRVRYRICTDAGGAIPEWAKEYAAKKTLPTNVADIVRQGLKLSGG